MAQRPLSIVVGLSAALLLVAGTTFGQTQTGGVMMMEPCMEASEMMMEPAMEPGDMMMKPCAEGGMGMEPAMESEMMDPAMGAGDEIIMAPEG